ncbi:hypothetical protein FHETE_9051 [Fusarium heterosporum]|uniref:Uncharacterized protein n=1 Tax=Fusarium heterosporum TaxID=42747 RepID=A0A8H5SYX4_FUSHE|nr:hypothetical protein FHETE_9051 [Fusarium heterosporum]
MTRNLYVPLEIILQVLKFSIPLGNPNRILSVATPEIQQLVSWARVCRGTYEPATQFLRQHCVHIDSEHRLQTFLKCLNYSEDLKESGHTSALPKTIPLSEISSIYLGLSQEETQSLRTAALIRDVLAKLGGSVRRLIVDLPFRKIAQQHSIDAHMDSIFSHGLRALHNLEEFVTLGGLPVLEFWRSELNIYDVWPKLRRLAGFKVNLSEEALWYNVARHRTIEHLIISMPYLLRQQTWNIKHAVGGQEWNAEHGGDSTYARPLKIVIANHEYSSPIIDTRDGKLYDPSGLLDVSAYEIPVIAKRVDWVCREWLIRAAKEDTLWG